MLHRTRTELSKWFVAAYLMGRDKRGVSAKFLQRELAVAYQTAWTMAHKLRHGLSEASTRPLRGFLEADETFIGGRGDPTSPGRRTANPDKSLVGWASGIRGAVWDGGAVHRAPGRASLARRICLRRLRRAASLAAEGTSAGL